LVTHTFEVRGHFAVADTLDDATAMLALTLGVEPAEITASLASAASLAVSAES
jgi:hypothetical protein